MSDWQSPDLPLPHGLAPSKTMVQGRVPGRSGHRNLISVDVLPIHGTNGTDFNGVAPANQTKERPVHELSSAGAFTLNKSSTCVSFVLIFPRKNTRIFTEKWAKFMNFSFWPFFWFGLPGRLLTHFNGTNGGHIHGTVATKSGELHHQNYLCLLVFPFSQQMLDPPGVPSLKRILYAHNSPRIIIRWFERILCLPKRHFRTKNAMALEILVFYYWCSVLLFVVICCRFAQGKQHLQTLCHSESLYRHSDARFESPSASPKPTRICRGPFQ